MGKVFPLAWTVLLALLVTAQAADPKVTEVPRDLIFWTGNLAKEICLTGFPWPWPSVEQVKAKAPMDAEAAEKAKQEAEDWLRLLTNERYIPNDVKDRMVLLDQDVDYIIARYVVDDLAIYWLQDKTTLNILVRKVRAEKVIEPADIGKLAQDVAQELFVGPHGPVPSVSAPVEFIRSYKNSAEAGTNESFYVPVTTGDVTFYTREDGSILNHQDKSLPYAFRWGLQVKTDGQTVQFVNIMKRVNPPKESEMEAQTRFLPPGQPIIKSWFSLQPDAKGEPATGPRFSP